LIRAARLVPNPLTREGPISVIAETEDADGDVLSYQYQWLVNGAILHEVNTHILAPDMLNKGDAVVVQVVVSDGKGHSAPFLTEPVQVSNSQPVVKRVNLELENPYPGARLQAKVEGQDADGDKIQYHFKWWRNNVLVKEGPEDVIDTAGFARKDSIQVDVLPRDEDAEGASYRAGPVVIGNAPPKIVSKPAAPDGHETYEYKVEAEDADGDALSYELETAPPGMVINSASGHIQWKVASEYAGTHRVKVSVNDSQGGLAWQEFELSIPASSFKPPASTPRS
jgi:hypothetical protein